MRSGCFCKLLFPPVLSNLSQQVSVTTARYIHWEPWVFESSSLHLECISAAFVPWQTSLSPDSQLFCLLHFFLFGHVKVECALCGPTCFNCRVSVMTALSPCHLSLCMLLSGRLSYSILAGTCEWQTPPSPPLFSMLRIIWPLDRLSLSSQVTFGNLIPNMLEISFPKESLNHKFQPLLIPNSPHTEVYRGAFQKQLLWTAPFEVTPVSLTYLLLAEMMMVPVNTRETKTEWETCF